MKHNAQRIVLQGIADIFRPVVTIASDRETTVQLFNNLGWDVEALLAGDITPLTNALTAVSQPLIAIDQLADLTMAGSASNFGAFKNALQSAKALGDAVKQLGNLDLISGLGNQFYTDILQKLLAAYLIRNHEKAYYFFVLVGVMEQDTVVIQQGTRYVKYGSKVPLFSFTKLLNFLKKPKQHIANEYWPNGIETDFATTVLTGKVGQKLLLRASFLLDALGIAAVPSLDTGTSPVPYSAAEAEVIKASMYVYKELPLPSGNLEVGLAVGLLSTEEGGPALYLGPRGVTNLATYVKDWLVQLQVSTQFDVLTFKQNAVEILGGTGNSGTVALRVSNSSDDSLIIGNQDGTRLELGQEQLGISLNYATNSYAIDAYVSSIDSTLAIYPDEGDSFLNKIIPSEGIKVKFDALLGWSSSRGFYFCGKAGFKNSLPINSNSTSKFLRIASLDTTLLLTDNLAVIIGASGEATLGPIKIAVAEIGLSANLDLASEGGNAGPFNLNLSFAPPTGVGITVDSDTIKGGGFLSVDPAAHRYTGVANLTFRDKLTLNAVGILQTELPDGRDGYSLLLLVTAQFSPIQLGLGFTLNGVGGLVGVNRTVDIPYLRSQVRTGGFSDLLFPANVLDNPGTALAAIDRAFPAAEGRYVFGLMAQIGWGSVKTGNATYSLLTLDAALLIELPAVRLALLGVLRLMLPNPERAVLRLRADFLGTVDFAAKKIAFDASLVDSSLLQFALTGDMAFRLYQGETPVFLLTTGGFHPAFQPPANAELPTIRRLPLALANSSDLRIILTSYVALTSNTVQFGSRLDLFMDLRLGLSLEGFIGFDVLFQFQPFRVQAYVGANAAIKWKGKTKLSIHLPLNVSGPAPWHVVGKAEFKAFGVKIPVRIDRTFGKGAISEPERAINVHSLFLEALNEASNWEMEPPTGGPGLGARLRQSRGGVCRQRTRCYQSGYGCSTRLKIKQLQKRNRCWLRINLSFASTCLITTTGCRSRQAAAGATRPSPARTSRLQGRMRPHAARR